jgi:hypothetical protein
MKKYRDRAQRFTAIRPVRLPPYLSRYGGNFLSRHGQGSVMLDTASCDIDHVNALSSLSSVSDFPPVLPARFPGNPTHLPTDIEGRIIDPYNTIQRSCIALETVVLA